LAVEFERITIEPGKMGGQPCIRRMRMPVATIVAMVAEGMTTEEILYDFPDLERDDISEVLRWHESGLSSPP
jgi:uncharacterized protein (DUF433 family)